MLPARRRFLPRSLAGLSGVTALAFFGMALVSFSFFTTVGIDSDRGDAPFVYYSYYRIRWPGDGSFRVGGGAFRYKRDLRHALEPFDLGGRFFLPPHHTPQETPHSFWNRMGFWHIANSWDDERTRTDALAPKPWEFWLGVPAFLPGLLFALLPFLRLHRSRATKARRETSH